MSIIPGHIIEQREFKSSSSNNIYTTILYDNCFACTCPAGGRRMHCKHVEKLISDNMDLLLNKFPDFAEKVCKIFSKDTDKEQKKILYKELSYSNKEIAAAAHNNTYNSDMNISEICKQAEARVERFKITLLNTKQQLQAALSLNVISEDDYNVATNALKKSVKDISSIDFEEL